MKPWILFVVGLLLGVVGGVLIGRGESSSSEKDGVANSRVTSSRGGDASESARQRSRDGRRGGRRSGSAGGTVNLEDLMTFLDGMAQVDDIEELNFLALLRHGHFITGLSENEASSLLLTLTSEADEDNGDDMRRVIHALVFARLAELNGPEAMRIAAHGELGEIWDGDEDDLAGIGMSSWVDADPEGAAEWFRQGGLGDPKVMELMNDGSVQNSFFAAMARHDTETALELLEESGGTARTRSIQAIARYQPTVEALEDLLDHQTLPEAREEVLEVLSDRDPAAAAGWLDRQGAIRGREVFVEDVADRYMNRELDNGVEWYMKQELSEERQVERLELIVQHLASEDLTRAGNWLEEQGDSAIRDNAEVRLAAQLANSHRWEESFDWMSSVENEQRQQDGVERIFRQGWDRENKTMVPEAESAAREAGYGEQLEEYIQKRTKRDD